MRRVMVHTFSVACFAAILCIYVSSGFAKNPLDKLVRGLSNSWTCQQEYIDAVHEELYLNGPIGIVTGSVKGVIKVALRAISAVYDIATFPIPIPWKYEPILKPDLNI